MDRVRRFLARLLTFVLPDRAERDGDREIAAHLALIEDDLVARGVPRERARIEAQRRLGGVDQTKERHRDARSFPWLEDARRDLSYAARQLWRDRVTAIVGIVSLAVGIAAVAAVYTAVDGVLLHPYPYDDVERTVAMRWTDRRTERVSDMPLSEAAFAEMLTAGAVEDGFLWEAYSTAVHHDGQVDSIPAGWLSPNTFRFFDVRPLLGRTFDGDVARVRGEPEHAVVLSARYWHRQFGGSPDVLGRSIQLDGFSYTIVGVASASFRFLNADIYIPLPREAGPFRSYIKLRPGVTQEAAAAELSAIFQHRAQRNGLAHWRDLRVVLTDMGEFATGHLAGVMLALSAAVGVLLLIGCANFSILLTSRGIARRHELTMRKALGASDGRLVRQLLTESLVSSTIAATLGIALAYALLPAIVAWISVQAIPSEIDPAVNGRVLAFAVIVALGSGLAAGLWPAFAQTIPPSRHALLRTSWRGKPGMHPSWPSLSPATRGDVVGAPERRLHAVHVIAQVALTLLLLAGSAAALRAFISLTRVSLGYDPADSFIVGIQLARGAFPTWAERTAYYERLRAALATAPGVASVAISLDTPPPVASGRSGLTIAGVDMTANGNIAMQRVSSEYFSTLRIPITRGRVWTPSEDINARHVAVVNEAFVRAFFPDVNPVGQQVDLGGLDRRSPYSLPSPNYDRAVEIVGVVADARNVGLRQPVMPAAYVPHTLLTWDSMRLLVRARGAPGVIAPVVRQRVAEVNGDQAVGQITSMTLRLRRAGWAQQQAVATLFLSCAAMALLLAAIGLYSVVSCSVSARRRELAVRMALGATHERVIREILRTTAATVLLGVACGLALIFALDAALERWTETSVWSVPTAALVTAVFAIAAAAAIAVPTRRALSLDPMAVLRSE